jgi:hypothetical protein
MSKMSFDAWNNLLPKIQMKTWLAMHSSCTECARARALCLACSCNRREDDAP